MNENNNFPSKVNGVNYFHLFSSLKMDGPLTTSFPLTRESDSQGG